MQNRVRSRNLTATREMAQSRLQRSVERGFKPMKQSTVRETAMNMRALGRKA